jgi:hypothetical protein
MKTDSNHYVYAYFDTRNYESRTKRLNPKSQGPTDWRSTIGMFGDDPIQKKIDAAGRKIRSADRRRTKK